MPLPSALAARLAKRGLVQKTKSKENNQEVPEVEEVFAEDYDEPDPAKTPPTTETTQDGIADTPTGDQSLQPDPADYDLEDNRLFHEVPDCPNRSNRYHKCSGYCTDRWGLKDFEADDLVENKRIRMLKKYPVPDNWEEVGDPETGRYYYWNCSTDEVSWLPPAHPRADVTMPTSKAQLSDDSSDDEKMDNDKDSEDDDDDDDDDEGDIMDIDDFEEIERKILMEKSAKEKEKEKPKPNHANKKRREEALDPMDPAAYSDISRGTWSSGLDVRGSAKTGVDATASGPLFQQRPYPSPGAILRMNKDYPKE